MTTWVEQTEIQGQTTVDSLVKNSFFEEGIEGWTDDSAGTALIGWNPLGYLFMTDQNSDNAQASRLVTGFTIGIEKIITLTVLDEPDLTFRLGISKGSSEFGTFSPNGLGDQSLVFTPTVTDVWLTMFVAGVHVSPKTVGVDNILIYNNDGTIWTEQAEQ